MTSNIGLQTLNQSAGIGFDAETKEDKQAAKKRYEVIKEKILSDLDKTFRPELLNRIDKIIVFKPLEKKTIEKIVVLQIKELQQRLSNQQLTLAVSKQAIKLIGEQSFKPSQGARAVRRHVQETIENTIATKLLAGDFNKGSTINVGVTNKKITLK